VKRILVVNEEAEILSLSTKVLSLAGYRVRTARTGCEAVELHARENFDLILLGLTMPGMDGAEMLAALEQHKPLPDIVLVTGTLNGKGESLRKLGAYARLEKPFTVVSLLEIVSRTLGS